MDAGLVRDVGIFAGAALGIHLATGFKKPPSHPLLDQTKHSLICRSSFLAPLVSLAKFCEKSDFESVLNKCTEFLEIVGKGNITRDGFEINRMANDFPSTVEGIVKRLMYDQNFDVAVKAMDYERDELKVLYSICDNMVRNVLLDARPYA